MVRQPGRYSAPNDRPAGGGIWCATSLRKSKGTARRRASLRQALSLAQELQMPHDQAEVRGRWRGSDARLNASGLKARRETQEHQAAARQLYARLR